MQDPADSLIQLSAYLDDELNGLEAGRTRQRLADCPRLREEYRRIKDLCELLTRWDKIDCRQVTASAGFEVTLTERLSLLRASELPGNGSIFFLSPASLN
ncbi:MAG: hypothetical protein FVQ81_00170 [Candidatus Glassbacteria bacterium]|nr:hypothetical protein [Candidatus Glassbacteria bacterium]